MIQIWLPFQYQIMDTFEIEDILLLSNIMKNITKSFYIRIIVIVNINICDDYRFLQSNSDALINEIENAVQQLCSSILLCENNLNC